VLFVGGLNSEHLLLSAVVASSVSAAVCGRVHIGATWRIQWIDLRVSLASSVSAAVRGDIGWGGVDVGATWRIQRIDLCIASSVSAAVEQQVRRPAVDVTSRPPWLVPCLT